MAEPIKPVDPPVTPPAPEPTPPVVPDTVLYSTHKKLLDEKKKKDAASSADLATANAKLATLEQEKKDADEAKLKENQQWKEYGENKDKELVNTKAELKTTKESISRAQKMNAFLEKLPGHLASEYYSLADLDKISVDPNTGEPDAVSVEAFAADFEKKYHKVIERGQAPSLPADAPRGANGVNLTVENWKTGSVADMKKGLAAQIATDNRKRGI